jgi:hypothetical protein
VIDAGRRSDLLLVHRPREVDGLRPPVDDRGRNAERDRVDRRGVLVEVAPYEIRQRSAPRHLVGDAVDQLDALGPLRGEGEAGICPADIPGQGDGGRHVVRRIRPRAASDTS